MYFKSIIAEKKYHFYKDLVITNWYQIVKWIILNAINNNGLHANDYVMHLECSILQFKARGIYEPSYVYRILVKKVAEQNKIMLNQIGWPRTTQLRWVNKIITLLKMKLSLCCLKMFLLKVWLKFRELSSRPSIPFPFIMYYCCYCYCL